MNELHKDFVVFVVITSRMSYFNYIIFPYNIVLMPDDETTEVAPKVDEHL